MRVADSNLIAARHFAGLKADVANAILLKECQWWVPPLWMSEFWSNLFPEIRMW